MTATTTVVSGRRLAESLMVDACTITRPGAGVGTFNPATGETEPVARVAVYSGKCRARARDVNDQTQPVAGQSITLTAIVVSIPWDTTGVLVGDRVTVTASNDPGLIARDLVVRSVAAGTFITARRLLCTDNQG